MRHQAFPGLAMNQSSQKLLIQLLEKIPIFDGLPPSQRRQLLSLCENQVLEAGTLLCRGSSPSDEMYILLTGQLSVVTAEGMRVATILPVTTVGEIGVITGQPRSATVEVVEDARIMRIQKTRFDGMLNEDRDMSMRIFRNVIHILAAKLVNDNLHLRDYQLEKGRIASRMTSLEHQLDLRKQRVQLLLDLIDERGFVPRDEAVRRVEEKTRESASRILVVDDEPDFRQLVANALPALTVVEAGNGREALEAIAEKTPDLVITDIKMPEMDGLALLEALRSQHPELPVLAVSGYMSPGELQDRGFDGVIHKPLKLRTFKNLVQKALDR